MSNQDRPVNVPPVKDPTVRHWLWLAAGVVAIAGLFIFFAVRDDDHVAATSPTDVVNRPPSPSTTTVNATRSEIVARLKEILAMRERAYQERDVEALKQIYTVDCPCLNSDSSAIRELIKDDYKWVGGEASLSVRKAKQVTARMWIVIADFHSAPLRIETESGRLVRKEPEGQDLFQFVLAKPRGSTQWLLGHASSYEVG